MAGKIVTFNNLGKVMFVKNRRAKKLTLTVKPFKNTRVTLPYYASYSEAEKFVLQHSQWIISRLNESVGIANEILRREAEWKTLAINYLPGRCSELAAEHHFVFGKVSIRASRTRWGSCSASNNINLSIYLMQLPGHLIDYVILHELVHTKVKNHSSNFWNLLDKHTCGKARALATEIRKFRIE